MNTRSITNKQKKQTNYEGTEKHEIPEVTFPPEALLYNPNVQLYKCFRGTYLYTLQYQVIN